VTDAAPALADADEVFQVLRAARMAGLASLLRDHRDQVKATLAWNIEKGLALGGEQIAAARAGHAEIFQRFSSFLADGGYEVLALPTVQVVPFPVEQEWVTEINGEPMTTYIDWMRSCSRITVTVHPAVSVPAGLTAAGLLRSAHDHEAGGDRPGKARVLPRQDAARCAASCMAIAPNRRSRWSLTATRPR
jgi:amidase